MYQEYLDFDIQVRAFDQNGFFVGASGPAGDASFRGLIHLFDEQTRSQISAISRLETDEQHLANLGRRLYEGLFQGPLAELLQRSRAMLGPEQGLRLRLQIDPGEERLVALPWEYLHDPNGDPLALLDTAVIRYVEQPSPIPPLSTGLPLRVLLTAAQTPPAADLERELGAVQVALGELADQLELHVEPHLTVNKLQALLRQGFHIWHFVGHGAITSDHSGGLLFEDPAGDAEEVSAMQLRLLLNRAGVRLVLLDACHSGELSGDPLRNLAPALLRAQVAAVVAMQFAVAAEATRSFAAAFYAALAEGLPLDACVTSGRIAIFNACGSQRPDWGVPVVFTRSRGGKLFELPSHPVGPAGGAVAGAAIQALNELSGHSAVADNLRSVRDDLHTAARRLALLRALKELHDQLQQLDNSYAVIARIGRRATLDSAAWEYLRSDAREISARADQVLDCAAQPVLGEQQVLWTTRLERGRSLLEQAVRAQNIANLQQALHLLGDLLSREPSRTNTRLVAAAAELRLDELLAALKRAGTALGELPPTAEISQRIELVNHGVTALQQLDERVRALVRTHDAFQAIDDQLRLIEGWQEQESETLRSGWAELAPHVRALCGNNQPGWSQRLGSACDQLEQALAATDIYALREAFLDLTGQINRSFNKVDWDLRSLCDELRSVSDELTPLLASVL